MLVTVNKKKHMLWHVSLAPQIASWKTLVMQTFFDVSNEICPILVTRFLDNELQDINKKVFGGLSKSTDEKEKEKKKEEWQLQSFLHYMQMQKRMLEMAFHIR